MVGNDAVGKWDLLGLKELDLPTPDSGDFHVGESGRDGENAGTIPPLEGGVNANLWGNKEANGFDDFVVSGCPDEHLTKFEHGRTRRSTSEIKDRSVDRIMIRSAPFRECEMREICRICKEGCNVTVAVADTSARMRKEMFEIMKKWAGESLGRFRQGGFQSNSDEFKMRGQYLSFSLEKGMCPCEKQRIWDSEMRRRLIERKMRESGRKAENVPPNRRH